MKNKFIIAVITFTLFAFSIAAFAYTATSTKQNSASCCGKDSCPLKKDGKDSCCDKADCCKDGKCENHDSCPMKSKENQGEMKDCPLKNKHKDNAKDN